MNSKSFATVDTLPKSDKKNLNPRATRYGLLPIWSMPTASRDFYVWEIPANTVFPFRPFIGETGQDVNGNVTYTHERMPQDQILDMFNSTQFFVELEPLARLGDETKAQRIADTLSNPNPCDKYPVELGTGCVTCWFKDSLLDMETRIKSEFSDDAELRKAARECMTLLRAGLTKAIDEARRQVDVAIRDIDDPKSGKSMFFDRDYKNVYHTHADRPTYKTSSSSANVGEQIASAIQAIADRKQTPAEPTVDVAKLVAEAVAAATKDLREQLASVKPAAEDKTELIKEKIATAKGK